MTRSIPFTECPFIITAYRLVLPTAWSIKLATTSGLQTSAASCSTSVLRWHWCLFQKEGWLSMAAAWKDPLHKPWSGDMSCSNLSGSTMFIYQETPVVKLGEEYKHQTGCLVLQYHHCAVLNLAVSAPCLNLVLWLSQGRTTIAEGSLPSLQQSWILPHASSFPSNPNHCENEQLFISGAREVKLLSFTKSLG